MATHSSILAWRFPWTEEPGGLQSKSCKESNMTAHTHEDARHEAEKRIQNRRENVSWSWQKGGQKQRSRELGE